MDFRMNVFKLSFIAVATLGLTACAGLQQADRSAQRIFTYDFSIPTKSQEQLFNSGRNYLAENYGDSNKVLKVIDKSAGTIIGKGSSSWNIAINKCAQEHHIRFAAKNGKARLQFEIIEGAPSYSACRGWDWPTKSGYKDIVASFNSFSNSFEASLKGSSKSESFADF